MSTTRKVTFKPVVEVRETLSIHDYTAREVSAAWFNESEMVKITKRCLKLIRKCEGQSNPVYCLRGLEGHTKSGSIAKRINKSVAYAAVFDEQARQWVENAASNDAQSSMADAYSRASSSCQMWAQVVGNQDRHVIEAYLFEDNDEEDRTSTQVRSSQKREASRSPLVKHESKILRKAVRTAIVLAEAA